MSTMRVTNLKHENSASNNIVLNSDGSVGGDLATTLASKLDLAGGKILQIVRATDGTSRTTTSTSAVDANISVTITPEKNDSAVLLIWTASVRHSGTSDFAALRITDNSNNNIAGAELLLIGSNTTNDFYTAATLIGYSTPATTSATTYKGRFQVSSSGTATLSNNLATGQLYAIEVSA